MWILIYKVAYIRKNRAKLGNKFGFVTKYFLQITAKPVNMILMDHMKLI